MKPASMEEALYFHGLFRIPVIVLAPPGGGKSTLFRKVFRKLGLDHHTVNLALSDGTESKGMPNFVKVGDQVTVRWVKEYILTENRPMALFVDETFQGPTQALNATAPWFLEGRCDDIFFHEGTWVCGATNRLEDKAGTNRPPSHIPNRVTILNGPDVDIEEWSYYMLDGGSSLEIPMNEYVPRQAAPTERDVRVVQFLRMKPAALLEFDPMRLVNATPRQWEWVAQFYPVIPDSVKYDVVAGRVGEGNAAALNAFVKIQDQLPPKEEILLNPKKARVPKEPSALYLVTGMLAQVANPVNFDSIAAYAERLPPEFQAMMVKDAMRKDARISSTKAFVQWGCKFAEVLRT